MAGKMGVQNIQQQLRRGRELAVFTDGVSFYTIPHCALNGFMGVYSGSVTKVNLMADAMAARQEIRQANDEEKESDEQ